MTTKRTLIIDTSSVLWMSLLAGKSTEFGKEVEFEGKKVWVNGWEYGLENAISHITAVARELGFHAGQMVFVTEGTDSKARRVVMLPEYKAGRGKRPPEAYAEFTECRNHLVDMFRAAGATEVTQRGVEGDDIIAYMCEKLEGKKVILSQDGDMAVLLSDTVSQWRNGALLTQNPYGPFPTSGITVYKALVGDTSDGMKGAKGFGDKAFLDMLVWGGDGVLPALRGVIERRELHTLEDDVAEFKPMRKIIDSAESVYASYACAKLYPEWVDTDRVPLKTLTGGDVVLDERVTALRGTTEIAYVVEPEIVKNHCVFDCELIGLENPVFLVCMKVVETGEEMSFWKYDVCDDMTALRATLERKDLTFVSFNGIHFDQPLIWAALSGLSTVRLKQLANRIIAEGKSFGMADEFGYTKSPEFDHIDLMEVSPGVKISLKAFAGRMHYPTMQDMPFDHDEEITPDQYDELERYCKNDLGVTEALFQKLRAEINLRVEMSKEHGIDLRSKSGAQVAEAILKKVAGIKRRPEQPLTVRYKAPPFIKTDSPLINRIIRQLEDHVFKVNDSGEIEFPEFLKDPVKINDGSYQLGIGGIHSTHDVKLYVESDDNTLISDLDVSSYYPTTIILADLIPKLSEGAGERFITAFREMFVKRMAAKRSGDKKTANSLKLVLNSTFGKMGSKYASFYSPDLMLAVTLTGQLNLLSLIHDIDNGGDIRVLSANTDGILVKYPKVRQKKVLRHVSENAVRTGYEYEETCYRKVAMANVNSYIAITDPARIPVIVTPDGSIIEDKPKDVAKRKGLFGESSLEKTPTADICSDAVAAYLKDGAPIEDTVRSCADITKFVSCRQVKGGGIEFARMEEVDDWELVLDLGTAKNEWHSKAANKTVKRKSKPDPVKVGVDGTKFGRIARWIMSTSPSGQICYSGSGNRVPKTDGARLMMTLPAEMPSDIDYDWYVREARDILVDIGVPTQHGHSAVLFGKDVETVAVSDMSYVVKSSEKDVVASEEKEE